MAKITKKLEELSEVILTLTRDEANALFTLVGRVGGPPEGQRGHTDKIYNALAKVGAKQVDQGLLSSTIRWDAKATKDYKPLCGISGCTAPGCKPETDTFTSF